MGNTTECQFIEIFLGYKFIPMSIEESIMHFKEVSYIFIDISNSFTDYSEPNLNSLFQKLKLHQFCNFDFIQN